MKRYLCLISCLFLLWGCAPKSVPAWKTASFHHLERYKNCFLSGREQLAAIYFQRAIDEIKSSGNLSLLMTAYLTRSALHVAVLEAPISRDYLEAAKAAPNDDHRDYYLLLEGKFAEVQKSRLPSSYQNVAAALEEGREEKISEAVREIQDDLSRLIAIGLVIRYCGENEAILSRALDVASVNGWRKPLFIYLDRLKSFYEKKNEKDKAENIRLKIELLKPSGNG